MKKRLIAVLCFIASMFFLPMQNVSAVLELPYFGYIPIVHYATGRNQRFPDEYIEIQNREIQKIQRWREEAEEEYYEEQLLNHLGEVQALLDHAQKAIEHNVRLIEDTEMLSTSEMYCGCVVKCGFMTRSGPRFFYRILSEDEDNIIWKIQKEEMRRTNYSVRLGEQFLINLILPPAIKTLMVD